MFTLSTFFSGNLKLCLIYKFNKIKRSIITVKIYHILFVNIGTRIHTYIHIYIIYNILIHEQHAYFVTKTFNHLNFYPSQKSLLHSCLLARFCYPLGLTRTSIWSCVLMTDRLSIRYTAKEYFLMS